MVVPGEATPWRAHVPAAGIVDLASDSDARVRHAALGVLGAALDTAQAVTGSPSRGQRRDLDGAIVATAGQQPTGGEEDLVWTAEIE